jgi:large subunit ribosomal protein L33
MSGEASLDHKVVRPISKSGGYRLVGQGRGFAAEEGGEVCGPSLWGCAPSAGPFALTLQSFAAMQEVVTLECTEARKEGKPPSRYLTTRNKKTVTERIEKMKYNPFLRRHTLHKEIK